MKPPESIILAFANSSSSYLPHQTEEIILIRDNALHNAVQNNHINVIANPGANPSPLLNILTSAQGRNVTMLHYSGHSGKDGLIIEWKEKNEIIKTESVVDLVKAHKKFRLIFLNGCFSQSIAQELITVGVPYVVGTTGKVNDRQAAMVAKQFYYFLAKPNKTIDQAFHATKLYFEDPSYDDDAGIRKAFRSFDLTESPTNTYPWQIYSNKQINELDKNWVLVPEEDVVNRPVLKKRFSVKFSMLLLTSVVLLIATLVFVVKFYVVTAVPVSKENPKADTVSNSVNIVKPLQTGEDERRHVEPSVSPPKLKLNKDFVINGNVTDGGTGEPLDSVTVSINGIKALTSNGRFKIIMPDAIKPEETVDLIVDYSFSKPLYRNRNDKEMISVSDNNNSHSIDVSLIKTK